MSRMIVDENVTRIESNRIKVYNSGDRKRSAKNEK